MNKLFNCARAIFLICIIFFTAPLYAADNTTSDPLPSWNNGTVKQNIIGFVQAVTDKNNPAYVPPAERIATIDNDGTLWVEQPMYTQVVFTNDRIKSLAKQDPTLAEIQPFKAVVTNDFNTMRKFDMKDLEVIMAKAYSGITTDDLHNLMQSWLATAKDIRFKRPYTELVYQPMLEVMNYLRNNNFKVYIVTGAGQDFVRAFSEKVYGVPVEQVIGSSEKTKYTYVDGKPVLMRIPEIFIIDDHAGKAEGIDLFIGRKPIIAFGNSDGDQQMLEWTQSGSGKRLMLLVHHDDAVREYAYDTKSKVGTFSTALMNEAKQRGWNVISMKNDWKVIFPPAQ